MWLAHVGLLKYTVGFPGKNFERKRAPRCRAPVPDMDCVDEVRFSRSAGEEAPRISFAAAEVKVARPAMGRYSWLRAGSDRRMSSA